MNAAMVLLAIAALGHFPLNHVELLRRDDRLVVSFHIVLRNFTFILLLLLGQVIDREALLQQVQMSIDNWDNRQLKTGTAKVKFCPPQRSTL